MVSKDQATTNYDTDEAVIKSHDNAGNKLPTKKVSIRIMT
jgi:hypothetical protein